MKINSFLFMLICISTSQWNRTVSTNDLHCSFWADYNQFNNKPHTAHTWYKKALKEGVPGYRYKGLLYLFKRTNNINQIISLMPSIEKSCNNDTEIELLFAQSLQDAGHQSAADEKFMKLLNKSKDNQLIAFQAAQIFMRRKEPENALETIKDYLAQAQGNPNNFIFHFLAAQTYLLLDKKVEALEQIEQSLNLHPEFDKGWLMFALLNEQTGQLKKAIKGYVTYLELTETASPQIQEHLLRLAFRQKLLESGQDQLQMNQSYLDQIFSYFKEGKYKEALNIIDKQLTKEHLNTNNAELKVQVINKGGHIVVVDNRFSYNNKTITCFQQPTLFKRPTKWYSTNKDQYSAFQKEHRAFYQTQAF